MKPTIDHTEEKLHSALGLTDEEIGEITDIVDSMYEKNDNISNTIEDIIKKVTLTEPTQRDVRIIMAGMMLEHIMGSHKPSIVVAIHRETPDDDSDE